MYVQDIDCYESVYFYQNYCFVNTERLLLGKYGIRDNMIYLYFKMPMISNYEKIISAKLILFKANINNPCYIERRNMYCISPLLVHFSTLGCAYIESQTDYGRCVYFEDRQFCTYEEVDITCIVKAWACNDIENKGVLINGVYDASMISIASSLYIPKVMRPIIRITFEDICIQSPIKALPCKVSVE